MENIPTANLLREVFQKLIDGNYVSDPDVFYVPLAGKIKPEAFSKILKPENVSWDVTGNVDGSTPDQIPVVFLTCFRVTYVPGGSAISMVKPYPRFGMENLHPGFWDLIAGRVFSGLETLESPSLTRVILPGLRAHNPHRMGLPSFPLSYRLISNRMEQFIAN